MKLIMHDKKLLKQLTKELKKFKRKHQELYSTPITSLMWEEMLHKSLAKLGSKTNWKPNNNHVSGKDMTLFSSGERISCKSGQITYVKRDDVKKLAISGSRLGKHKTLKEKIAFISDKNEDSYACLARNKNDKIGKSYKLIMFPSSLLDYGNMSWTTSGKNYNGKKGLVECKIQSSLSDQLWTFIADIEKIPDITIIEI